MVVGGYAATTPHSFSSIQSLLQINPPPPPSSSSSITCSCPLRHSCSLSISSTSYKLDFSTRLSPPPPSAALRPRVHCNSTSSPAGPPPGENESRSILDAFFLGKAVAEALSERIESTVGELLSAVGRLQAEQQKQVHEFQEEVLERAKRAKEKAAREAIEEQGFIPSPAVTNYSSQVKSSDTSRSSSSSAHDAATATPTVSSSSTAVNIDGRPTFNTDQDNADQDPLSGLSTDRLM